MLSLGKQSSAYLRFHKILQSFGRVTTTVSRKGAQSIKLDRKRRVNILVRNAAPPYQPTTEHRPRTRMAATLDGGFACCCIAFSELAYGFQMFKAGKKRIGFGSISRLGVSGPLTDGQGSIARTLRLMYNSSHSFTHSAAGVVHTLWSVPKVRAVV